MDVLSFEEREAVCDEMMDAIVPKLSNHSITDGRILLMMVADQCQVMVMTGLPKDRQEQLIQASQRAVTKMLEGVRETMQ